MVSQTRRKRRFKDPTAPALPAKILIYGFLIFLSLLFLVPFLLMVMASFTQESEIMRNGFSLFPSSLTGAAYSYLFGSSNQFVQAFKVTSLLTVVGTTNALVFSALGAYALSKPYLPYRKGMTIFVAFTMLFNGGLIPWYLIVDGLNLTNTFFALFIPSTIQVWNLIIMRNFFQALPLSLEESARLDGATDWQVFFRIMLPLSKPILATMIVYMGVGYWNEWYNALILTTTKKELHTLQLLLRSILSTSVLTLTGRGGVKQVNTTGGVTPSESLRMAAVVVATVPILVIYPFLQRYFVKGIMVGSIKG